MVEANKSIKNRIFDIIDTRLLVSLTENERNELWIEIINKLISIGPTRDMVMAADCVRPLWDNAHCDNRFELAYSKIKPQYDAMLRELCR